MRTRPTEPPGAGGTARARTVAPSWRLLTAVAVVVALGCAAGAGVPATRRSRTAGDEPQYLLTARSLASDGDLNIADELAAGDWRAWAAAPLPEQTKPLAGGRRVSPHSPLLPVVLAVPVALGGWLGAKLALCALAGLLAAALTWVASRRLAVPPATAALVAVVFGLSPPLSAYAVQVYPELPAGLLTVAAVGALLGPLRRGGQALLAGAIVALPWLALKYAPVAAAFAVLGLWRLWRGGAPRQATLFAGVLALCGVVFLAAHQAWYGGWTPYAAGDHFVGGEFTAVGVSPDLWGRSRRLLGLLVDARFGLVAWQPAWLLVVPAVGEMLGRRMAGRVTLAAALAAGWLTATFVALTMHGWWWPGRQVVVVAPAAVLAVAVWAGRHPRRQRLVVGLGVWGIGVWWWLVVEGLAGRINLVVDFAATSNPAHHLLRAALPDYLDVTWRTWALHVVWGVVVASLGVAAWRSGYRARTGPAGSVVAVGGPGRARAPADRAGGEAAPDRGLDEA